MNVNILDLYYNITVDCNAMYLPNLTKYFIITFVTD